MAVKPIPDGYHSVTAYLTVDDAAGAIDFYTRAFGATEVMRMAGPDGKIGHAEIKIGNSHVMLGDENPAWGARSVKSIGGSPIQLMIYVDNVDTLFPQALAAGGKEVRPLENQFYGDRSGTLTDPYGLVWTVSTHVEDVTPDEMARRAEAYMKQQAV